MQDAPTAVFLEVIEKLRLLLPQLFQQTKCRFVHQVCSGEFLEEFDEMLPIVNTYFLLVQELAKSPRGGGTI